MFSFGMNQILIWFSTNLFDSLCITAWSRFRAPEEPKVSKRKSSSEERRQKYKDFMRRIKLSGKNDKSVA